MKIFISHAISDKELINRLKTTLEPHGITLLIAEHYISLQGTITDRIEKFIKNCDLALILLTKNGFNSNFVQQEIGYIKSEKKKKIIVAEKGIEKSITGFIYGSDYIPYDPNNPHSTISKIEQIIISILNKIQERKTERNVMLGVGLFLGALFLISDDE